MGVGSRRWMWVESMGVRSYIDYLKLLSLLLLYLFFFAAHLFAIKTRALVIIYDTISLHTLARGNAFL